MTITRPTLVDAIKEQGFGISYRGFINSKGEKMLAVDPIDYEIDAVRAFITRQFPHLMTDVISCEPYRSLRRIIVGGFETEVSA